MTDPVIGVAELSALGEDAALADVRWYLDEPGLGRRNYEAGHLPGAVYVDLDVHLSAAYGAGRHPLPVRQEFAARMGRLGFGEDDLIVAYDDRGGAIAARMWWMLRDIGHERVRVLDGGIDAWTAAGHPLQSGIEYRSRATMSIRPGPTLQLDRTGVAAALGTVTLIDARAPERYRGDEEPVDPVAGHIPTAHNAPTDGNLADDGTFLGPDALRARFERIGVGGKSDTVVYCGSGVTACHNALALVRAGFDEPVLYPGSWSDWSASGGPVATGAAPSEA
jgi:thiosulfate/3-mercaptopyruvate sulfurtransferase